MVCELCLNYKTKQNKTKNSPEVENGLQARKSGSQEDKALAIVITTQETLMAWTSVAAAYGVRNGPNSGCILKIRPTGFAVGVGAVYEKKKCRETQRSQPMSFFFPDPDAALSCQSSSFFLPGILIKAWRWAWRQNRHLVTYRDKHEENNILRISE